MDMSVHQRPRAQDQGRNSARGAMIAGLVTLACLIAVPVELLELGLASIGISELLPVLAPPIGWPVRMALALCGAALAAALGGALGGDGAAIRIEGVGSGMKGNGIMGWTRNLGLHHLARLARGGDAITDAYTSMAPVMRGSALRKPAPAPSSIPDLLRRNRKDMHPDAPPRAPLIASRDLPVVTELSVIEAGPEVASPPPPIACVSPIRDTTCEIRPRPLPRSPAPLSDSDLSWVRALLASRGEDQSASAPAVQSVDLSTAPMTDAASAVGEVSDASQSLRSLVNRFEQGVAHRIALRDAANALERVESLAGPSVTSAPAPAGSTPVKDGMDEARDVPLEIDTALDAALATLRKLSAKANGR